MVLPLATFDLHFDRPVNVQQGSKLTSAYVPRASSDLLNNLSETFFVWLSHPSESFWVNLNPTESDRVVERNIGHTEVGRIMLEADLSLKKTAARLLHPDHPIVRRYSF